jgi:4'-phosphopantetheinyl transferase
MHADELQWRSAIPGELIKPNEVHVLRVCLDPDTPEIDTLPGILSADELARAGRFHFEKDQKRFIAARGMLRQILGQYLGKKPNEICFEYNSFGKPVLAANPGSDKLCFNLSHSGEFALYAVSRGRNIGIDIERVRNNVAVGQIARRFFSEAEIRLLERIDKDLRSEVFFQYWTRKEAFLKAIGEGISFPMEKCDVSSMNGKVLSPVLLPGESKEMPCWYGLDLFPGRGYAAAVVVEGSDWEVSCWHYSA